MNVFASNIYITILKNYLFTSAQIRGFMSEIICMLKNYPCAASRFHPGTWSISLWSADIVDMACTYVESLERKMPKH